MSPYLDDSQTSLLVRLTDDRYLNNPDPTLGVEFGSKLITVDEETIKLQCKLPDIYCISEFIDGTFSRLGYCGLRGIPVYHKEYVSLLELIILQLILLMFRLLSR